jgi:hypothetical protein
MQDKLTIKQIREMAKQYLYAQNDQERINIIKSAWSSGNRPAVELLAKEIGIDPKEMLNWTLEYFRLRRKCKWRKTNFIAVEPPKVEDYHDEEAKIAEMAAGINAEKRYGRRNTFSKTINNVARKM